MAKEKKNAFMEMYKKDKDICVLFHPEKKHCVGLTVKECDAHGKAILSDGSEYKCAYYKNLEDELKSRKIALARCEETGITFQENDRINIDFDRAEQEIEEDGEKC